MINKMEISYKAALLIRKMGEEFKLGQVKDKLHFLSCE